MNYLTLEELSEFLSINTGTIRIFLQHFTLDKHTKRLKIPTKLTKHNPPHTCKTARVFTVNEASIFAFEKYLKMKGYAQGDFKTEIKEFCKMKRSADA